MVKSLKLQITVIGAKVIDAKGMYIVPGFVSLCTCTVEVVTISSKTVEAFEAATKAHLNHGATTIFPTISSSSFATLKQVRLFAKN